MLKMEDVRPSNIALRSVDRRSDYYEKLRKFAYYSKVKPITVRKRLDLYDDKIYYEIIDGLHRYTVCKELGYTHIPARIVNCQDSEEAMIMQIMCSKEGLPVTDEEYSRQLQRLMSLDSMMTINVLALKIDRTKGWISAMLGLGELRGDIWAIIINGDLVVMNAYGLAKLNIREQAKFYERAKTMSPQEFIPLVNNRVRELADAEAKYGSKENWNHPCNPCGEVTLTAPQNIPPPADLKRMKKDIVNMHQAFNKAINNTKSAFDLLHEKAKIVIDYDDIREKGQPIGEPLTRSGWDHIRGHGDAAYAYCRGDVLVLYTGRCWAINNPRIPKLSNLSFITVVEAQEFVESCGA